MVTVEFTNDEALRLLLVLNEAFHGGPGGRDIDVMMIRRVQDALLKKLSAGDAPYVEPFMAANIAVNDMPPLIVEEINLCKEQPIQAIRSYRARTGAALKQAKDKVDAYRRTIP